MNGLITLDPPALGELESAVLVDFGQSRVCDAVEFDAAGHYRSCRRVTAWYRDGRTWALCLDHAYSQVTVKLERARRRA